MISAENEQHTPSSGGTRRAFRTLLLRTGLNLVAKVCLARKMSLPLRFWPGLLLIAVVICCAAGSASVTHGGRQTAAERSFAARERTAFLPSIHKARFNDIPHTLARSTCENTRPPEALATPNPLLPGSDATHALIVSFIVGTDGLVHSALVLQGNSDSDDQLVLQVVKHWRYRPATCNGVPTESEAKVEFSRSQP